MKNKTLTVRKVDAADVYKDIVRIDIETRGQTFQESKIYKLKCNGQTHLVSVRGMTDQSDCTADDICMDMKTRSQFGVQKERSYDFTLKKPICQPLALIHWSSKSSDPLQRLAALWAFISLGFGLLGLFGLTVPQMMTYAHNALTYMPH